MKHQRSVLRAGTLAALLTAAGCTDGSDPVRPDAQPGAGRAQGQAAGRAAVQARTLDDDFVELAREVPGFGGLYVGADGVLNVVLTDPAGAPGARGALASHLARHGRGGAEAASLLAGMRAVRGRHDFAQLRGWYRQLTREPLRGVTLGDVDEARNRVVIGVRDAGAAQAVRDRAAALGVPSDAISVEVVAETRMEARLIDVVRPIVGGTQISSVGGTCTLGWNARQYDALGYWTGRRFIITNAHCTDAFGVVTGHSVGQPDMNSPIASEVLDPAPSALAGCPAGRLCRYSDAALFEVFGSQSVNFPQIANVGSGTSGTAGIIGTWAMDEERIAYVGDEVGKVGRTTGYSKSLVDRTCVDIPQYDPYGYDTGRTLLCQAQAGYTSGGGDSGSPVYLRVNSTTRYAVGIHWGSGGTFSQIYHVLREFRDTDGWNYSVADQGFFH
jgi:hypothetical protein